MFAAREHKAAEEEVDLLLQLLQVVLGLLSHDREELGDKVLLALVPPHVHVR